MSKSATFISLGTIILDRTINLPLYRQLYQALRDEILSGQLAPCTRLPSTRVLAEELNVSRNTIVNAYDQLVAEGYIESLVGSGTCVTSTLPDEILHVNIRSTSLRLSTPVLTPAPRLSEQANAYYLFHLYNSLHRKPFALDYLPWMTFLLRYGASSYKRVGRVSRQINSVIMM